MKIAFLGALMSTDSEFPLIRELQRNGVVDVNYYIPAVGKVQNGGVFNLKLKKEDNIINASKYEEFQKIRSYFDISKIFVINNYHYKLYDIRSWTIWIKFIIHLRKQKTDVFHFSWPFRRQQLLLLLLNIKKVMTVHDPVPHSGQLSSWGEWLREIHFNQSSKLILLSDALKNDFIHRYNIPEGKVVLSRFGYYDWVDGIYKKGVFYNPSIKYVLFCGQIQSHKGVDVLLDAMSVVHKFNSALKCIIAGSGDFYFDIEPYRTLDYIEIRNYFISMDEMIKLVCGSLFVICPYKDATQSGIVQLSLSAGTPMIVTNVGDLPKSVKDGVTGIVVPPSDKEALAKAIIKLSGDDKLQNRFRENIENIWKRDSTWREIGNDYIKVYQSLSI